MILIIQLEFKILKLLKQEFKDLDEKLNKEIDISDDFKIEYRSKKNI